MKESQHIRKRFYQLKYLISTWIGARTENIPWWIHNEVFSAKLMTQKQYILKILFYLNFQRSQQKVKTTDFSPFLMFSKQC